MADNGFFSHTGLDGSSPFDRMRQAGYNFLSAGENVAYGYATPQAVMDAWMNSPGHRDNILQPLYTEIGIGVAVHGGTSGPIYWTQDFGSRQGGAPPVTPPALRPSLTGITPASARPGDRVSLAGSALGSAGTVTFPAGQAARVVAWSDTRVDVEVPQGAQSGDVYLQNGAGTSNGVRFEVLGPTGPPSSRDGDPAPGDPNRPRIDAIANNTLGFVTMATLTGRNFGWSRGTVTFNGVAATVISGWSPERIELLVPWNA